MFEKLGQRAQEVATSVSRRQFLGRFGCAAMAAAALVGGMATEANGGRGGPKHQVYCDPATSFPGCDAGHIVGSSCRTVDGNGTCQELVPGTRQCICSDRRRRRMR